MLNVQLLSDSAKAPSIGHPGEDLGYDLYVSESAFIPPHGFAKIPTGVALEFTLPHEDGLKFGFVAISRTSLLMRRLRVEGVIDAGYRGEVFALVENHGDEPQEILAGEKVANLIPIPVVANKVQVVADLTPSLRGENAFGSTGVE